MKEIIDCLLYDSKTAQWVTRWDDFTPAIAEAMTSFFQLRGPLKPYGRDLYHTKNDRWFVVRIVHGKEMEILPILPQAIIIEMQRRGQAELLEKWMDQYIEDA